MKRGTFLPWNYQITKLPSYPVHIKHLVHRLWKRKHSKGGPLQMLNYQIIDLLFIYVFFVNFPSPHEISVTLTRYMKLSFWGQNFIFSTHTFQGFFSQFVAQPPFFQKYSFWFQNSGKFICHGEPLRRKKIPSLRLTLTDSRWLLITDSGLLWLSARVH